MTWKNTLATSLHKVVLHMINFRNLKRGRRVASDPNFRQGNLEHTNGLQQPFSFIRQRARPAVSFDTI